MQVMLAALAMIRSRCRSACGQSHGSCRELSATPRRAWVAMPFCVVGGASHWWYWQDATSRTHRMSSSVRFARGLPSAGAT